MPLIMGHTTTWRRPVFKIGSSTLTGGTDELSLAKLADLVEQIAAAHADGMQPIVVSSGAVAAGRHRLGLPRLQKDVALKQMLAAVGQGRLMHLYDQFFDFHGITTAQVLLTRTDLSERGRYLNARNTLLGLCERRVVPIVNENDVVATEEIQVGDNDTLSAMVATLVDADVLVLVSDIAGLYTANPQLDPHARLIPDVPAITPDIEACAGGSTSTLGTGGMATKIAAAKLATSSGAEVLLVDGREAGILLRVLKGESAGTHFAARADTVDARRRWILSGMNWAGGVAIDAGAARALVHQGASLLAAGIVTVDGTFDRGDAIDITVGDGRLARGIANYASSDVRRIMGRRSSAIEDELGYSYGDSVVHRDDLVLLSETGVPHA